ncbi:MULTISPECIES: hypothetical protein [Bacillota]|jgi:hypothetical protein|uniref:Uncharacterized protein n=4 Tax=Erysipelotrichaceae TaxID=128827 RepID=A0A7G9GTM9_9FIRM|nr:MULTISPECIES: hypothetical protein [Bacillota]QNM14161.1 hypothetical protein H9Q80_09605 [[Eubacterium] hominis]MCH4285578.1 hypothetical protein [Amedibacillus hominis]RGB52510.1 hypothetical protein DW120_20100 [Absiella sp. AM10-20]RGB54104.1 hypothetical protein DW271_11780 [Absiella sp. AM22-9]RGB64335.1 hypothetical protein DW113_15305 [Absiella sp. AM09-45]
MYNRVMRKKVTKENYRYMQRKGRQNLKVLLILFYMFLLCYSVINYFMVKMLFVPKEKDAMLIFMVKTISMLVIWGIIIRMLWRFRKVGRTLFAAFTIISLYTLVDMLQVLEYPIVDKTDNILRYLFAILLVLKTILTCSCMLKMRTDPTMRCIWSRYIIYEDALDEDEQLPNDDEEENPMQGIPFQNDEAIPLILRLPQRSPLIIRAKKRIRINAFLLVMLCFGGFLFCYLFLYLMHLNNRHDAGIPYIQRMLMLSTLYSILIWMFPMVTMFFYHRITKPLIFIAWLCELVRQVAMLPEIMQTCISQKYSMLCIILLLIMEAARYLCFYRLTMRLLKDPFIHAYWSGRFKTKEPYE